MVVVVVEDHPPRFFEFFHVRSLLSSTPFPRPLFLRIALSVFWSVVLVVISTRKTVCLLSSRFVSFVPAQLRDDGVSFREK